MTAIVDIDTDLLKLHAEEAALRMLKSEPVDNLVAHVKQESGAGLSLPPVPLAYALIYSRSC